MDRLGDVLDDQCRKTADDINAKYKRELATLTGTGWRAKAG